MRLLVNILFKLFNQCRLSPITHQRLPCTVLRNVVALMATNSIKMTEHLTNTFKGNIDRFNGVTVNSKSETCSVDDFADKVDSNDSRKDTFKVLIIRFVGSLKKWRDEGRRGIWFKVHLDQSDWVPVLTKRGFCYHHAKEDFVMMYLWLPVNENCNIPPYAHTMIGVGAVVINDKNEILVVSEKYYQIPHWKLPGGYVEPGENLVDAAIREVLEETGVETEFQSVLTLRQGHYGMFDCSDIYTVISLKPLSTQIEKCEREIDKCVWMNVDEYLTHPNIHELNKFFVQKYLEYAKQNLKIDWHHGIHQLLKKAYTVYYVTSADDNSKK